MATNLHSNQQGEDNMQNVKLSAEAIARADVEPTHVQGGITRWMLQKVDFPEGCTIDTSIIEVQAGTNAAPHTHPGVEIGYVLGGEFYLVIEGRPDQNLKVGDSYSIPAGAVHYAKVPGDKTLRVHCAFIGEKGKPIATVESQVD
jgi:quercetin dioxygenase-like cupin family protein